MQTKEKRQRLAPRRSPKVVVRADRLQEDNTETLIAKQAAWIARRAGLAPDRARLVAELAFRGAHL